tara:strand:+ start:257 stop:925 length:669 start_codon:yes stop_codon:yes gene_type:complete
MAKLKDLLKEELGGIVSRNPFENLEMTSKNQDLTNIVSKLMNKKQQNLMTKEELSSAVNNYGVYGNSIYGKHNIAEIAKTFVKIAEASQKHVVDETADWFDKVTVQRNMKDLKSHAGQFNKIATEAKALQDRMSALYEDMGNILNRYFEIKELNEDRTPDALKKVKMHVKGINQSAKALAKAANQNSDKDMMDEVLGIIYFAEEVKKIMMDKKSYQQATQNR